MYIPSHYRQDDSLAITAFIRQYPFGIFTTASENVPFATHLPFLMKAEEGALYLYSHMSRVNPQGGHLGKAEALAIFREPHAYISPALYERKENVPTWNYVAVHAYGIPEIIAGKAELMQLQEDLILLLEPAYLEQFRLLPAGYLDGMLRGITGFKMKVTRLYGKEKLSQNKTKAEQDKIAESLLESGDTVVSEIGRRMKEKD